jgi:hypothetical protein
MTIKTQMEQNVGLFCSLRNLLSQPMTEANWLVATDNRRQVIQPFLKTLKFPTLGEQCWLLGEGKESMFSATYHPLEEDRPTVEADACFGNNPLKMQGIWDDPPAPNQPTDHWGISCHTREWVLVRIEFTEENGYLRAQKVRIQNKFPLENLVRLTESAETIWDTIYAQVRKAFIKFNAEELDQINHAWTIMGHERQLVNTLRTMKSCEH